MKTIEELEKQYVKLPNEIKEMKRWVCYWKQDHYLPAYDRSIPAKCPMNAISGRPASTTSPMTWSSFEIALSGCVKYGFDGIGFMLGNGIFGVDLDNHADKNGKKLMSDSDFERLAQEFITSLNSYTEKSQSGDGYHIICKGRIPEGACRKEGTGIEMYDSVRYFAMTGNIVRDMMIENREEEVKALWEKYLKTEPQQTRTYTVRHPDGSVTFGTALDPISYGFGRLELNDEEIIERIKGSKSADDFARLYINGDLSQNGDDHSAADLALCTILAFWCGKNKAQMDRIFRSSALMRDKWDRKIKNSTYGDETMEKAISSTFDVYTPPKEKFTIDVVQANNIVSQNNETESNIDENGDPVIKEFKKSFKHYSYDDTGNAERFYDYFGHLFKFNTDYNSFMFWNNKTWVRDVGSAYAKKYADVLIRVLKKERNEFEKKMEDGDFPELEIKKMEAIYRTMCQNINRVSNKTGKEAMLTELQHLHTMPANNRDFNVQADYLNTLSGVVDLTTGEIMPFDKNLMLSLNTNCRVSYEKPKVFLGFLGGIFQRSNPEETQIIIDFVQKFLGNALTGRRNKEHLGILYGEGSNGKSTFIQTIKNAFGDYGKSMNSAILVHDPKISGGQSTEFALSSLYGARFVATSETAEGKHLDEVTIKQMTSGEEITAQYKFGAQFWFYPQFTPIMSTNNKPIIRAMDYGTWRRLIFIPFLHIFKDEEKDINMPAKLAAELPQILGWMIQGNIRLLEEDNGQLKTPKCLEEALADYKNEMNVLSAYLSQRCQDFSGYETQASILYEDYKNWCKNNTEYLMSETKFGREMTKRGYNKKKTRNGVFYIGLRLFSDKRGHIFSDKLGEDNE